MRKELNKLESKAHLYDDARATADRERRSPLPRFPALPLIGRVVVIVGAEAGVGARPGVRARTEVLGQIRVLPSSVPE